MITSKKICHFTSPHPRYDTRIFRKECSSLADQGYRVDLIVADGEAEESVDKIHIHGIKAPKNKLVRVFITPFRILRKAIQLNADLYHFHDPELIIIGLILRLKGKKVIYDIHEDLPRQLFVQKHKSKFKRKTMEFFLEKFENFGAKRFSALITATPHIGKRFRKLNDNTWVINNFPILNELAAQKEDYSSKKNEVCYVGGILRVRGIIEMVQALEFGDTKLNICGEFPNSGLKEETMELAGWNNVIDHGFSSREKVGEVMSRSLAGLVLFQAYPNHINSQPNKLFEYMSASLPVIMSNFEYWKEITDKYACGISVDPENPIEVAEAIKKIKNNPKEAKQMGENARKAVEEVYNWSIEKKKLLALYAKLLDE
ncbi:glycosyltransferase [Flagellimonas aequoris]|uniref:Glycosyltransferase n=1 Tax=Flagellimonas aequoris TaxID=2306997 RepID=A0A418N9Y0_9FLAO|nr:glycosyltransferase [Allomuricauda aequoris]RIV72561.1 glycosyltransferase [Allomuricauda aequoris]TXK05061.1 glycosyltransferase family 4 protein [Allomuricauda aequoris]